MNRGLPFAVLLFVSSIHCDVFFKGLLTDSRARYPVFSINNQCQALAVTTNNSDDILRFLFDEQNLWSGPDTISSLSGVRWLTGQINNSGNAVISWISDSNKNLNFSYYNGTSWSAPATVESPLIGDMQYARAAIGIDDNNNLLIVFQIIDMSGDTFGTLYYSTSINQGANWTPRTQIASQASIIDINEDSTQPINFFSFSRTGKGSLIWVTPGPSSGGQNVSMALFKGNTFGTSSWTVIPQEIVADAFTGSRNTSVNDSGNAVFTWFQEKGAFSFAQGSTAICTNGTVTFSPEVCLSELISGLVSDPSLCSISGTINNNGRILVVWVGNVVSNSIDVVSVEKKDLNADWMATANNGIAFENLVIDLAVQVCNDDNGDGVAVFNNSQDPAESSYIVFEAESSSWNTVNRNIFPDVSTNAQVFSLDCAKSTENGSIVGVIGGFNKTFSVVGCGTLHPLNPGEPSNLVGRCCLNRFPTQGEYFQVLSWTPSKDANTVAQNIYRNGVLLATVSSRQSSYTEHNRPPGKDVYTVRSVSTAGTEGPEVSVTIIC